MKITIVSPGKTGYPDSIEIAKDKLIDFGFKVKTAKHATAHNHYFSGTDSERLQDLQQALNCTETDFILCSRGGYGTIRIINKLNFDKYKCFPKPIIGFSDITVLHNKMHQLGFCSIHAPMAISFKTATQSAIKSLINVLQKKPTIYKFKPHPQNINGVITAPIVGGNLAILTSLIGTSLELKTQGCILFIEDTSEAIYQVERMLWQLKMSNCFNNLKGLIVGSFTNIEDTTPPYGQTVTTVIKNMVKDYKFPVCFNFPAGHINNNHAIVLGKSAVLSITDDNCIFKQ